MKNYVVPASVLAFAFLHLHHYWFTMRGNEFFGRRDECEKALLAYVRDGIHGGSGSVLALRCKSGRRG